MHKFFILQKINAHISRVNLLHKNKAVVVYMLSEVVNLAIIHQIKINKYK